jgi:hypothetical protein
MDRLEKLNHAAELAMSERALLLDENRLLFEQNNEKTTRQPTRSRVVGHAKMMSYEDGLKAQRKRDAKAVSRPGSSHHKTSQSVDKVSSRREEKEKAKRVQCKGGI